MSETQIRRHAASFEDLQLVEITQLSSRVIVSPALRPGERRPRPGLTNWVWVKRGVANDDRFANAVDEQIIVVRCHQWVSFMINDSVFFRCTSLAPQADCGR